MYEHTTGYLPEPSQVVFCHSNTPWEEVLLLLERCKRSSEQFPERTMLYALINVDQLPTETQFKLVKEVKTMKKWNDKYLLAIICCGGHYHHIIDKFSPRYTHRLRGLSDIELQTCFAEGWPGLRARTDAYEPNNNRVDCMTFLTSTQPGLGKSEYVKQTASVIEHGVCTMAVDGPINKDGLIKQLKHLSRRKHCVLHIDVSHMVEPQIFDSFVFEVVIIGMAVSGTLMCQSPSSVVILEVANTQADMLRNSLPICSAFSRKHLQWAGFEEFIVSDDINSPVQVVCHYLKAMNEKTLDAKDIVLAGSKKHRPLKTSECQAILKSQFPSREELSFTIIETFLGLFAQELRRMSVCLYFYTTNIGKIVETKYKGKLRTNFVGKMLEVSKRFSAPSVKFFSSSNRANSEGLAASRLSSVSADSMVARMKDMILWNDSNHLFIIFHRQDSQSVTPIYKDIGRVPPDIRNLFETQMSKQQTFLNYGKMSHTELQMELEKICRESNTPFDVEKLKELKTSYALTPDNFLKMILIYLRIQSHIPVIIMGETGCGKTTLVQYLARVSEVPFYKMNLHAGVTEEMIVKFINDLKSKAKGSPTDENTSKYREGSTHTNENDPHAKDADTTEAEDFVTENIWVFLDEINTCDHLGLLNEIVCHHRCKGKFLPANLVFVAACNPYRLKPEEESSDHAGLETHDKRNKDEQSKLVYRVHPLPESMMDFVWDYGALDEEDEGLYIKRMLGEKEPIFIELVVLSQHFMRKYEGNNYCVSLRDVNRCKHLKKYFMEEFFVEAKHPVLLPGLYGADHFVNRVDIRSMILALCHCYHSRLTKAADRRMYRMKIAELLTSKNAIPITHEQIQQMIELEQNDLLNRMKLESGTAKNEALRENVFVMLVSILNKVPVFVIGKPGCSKSLSMQLIRSTLRGPDSHDDYFKMLPSVYVVSYKGSESSTSEGILKVFEKAKNYKEHNPNVMPVVLLDEVGLAENSCFNPLRVLHSQLEPKMGGFPPIAVVGISNWALDSAKMNRAIHLSRPEPTIEDLETTALSIRNDSSSRQGRTVKPVITKTRIKNLAQAYFDYQSSRKHRDFHRLRDYYSLIKYIAIEAIKPGEKKPDDIVEKGLLRNFSGKDTTEILNAFCMSSSKQIKVTELIEENLSDQHARHLMLIGRGDSALNILEQFLEGKEHKIIYGSRLKNDQREEYNYQILSEIILCMERGLILVMKDLECIYGSLYDMLNQSYTIVGKKKNCRVALGAYSNPMCQVHDSFRCVVIVDEKKVNHSDPPFLNRFEKQLLNFTSIMSGTQTKATAKLEKWTKGWHMEEESYHPEDIFLGFHDDTLASLVYWFMDAANMLFAKCQIDQYLKNHSAEKCKFVFLVVHLDRSQAASYTYQWNFNFLCGWNQLTIDSLESTAPVLDQFLWKSIPKTLESPDIDWQTLIDANMFLWCFNCIRYTENSRSVDSSFQLVNAILHSNDVMDTFKAQIVRYFQVKERNAGRNSWQTEEVACSTELLKTYSTLVEGMIEYIKRCVRVPLAKIVLFLEKSNSWNGSCILPFRKETDTTKSIEESVEEYEYWKACFQEDKIFDISDDSIGEPQGSESCSIARSMLNVRYPFFTVFNKMIESHLEWLLKGANIQPDSKYDTKEKESLCLQLCDLLKKVPKLNHNGFLERHKKEFVHDLLNAFSERYVPHLQDVLRIEVMEMLMRQFKLTTDETVDSDRYVADYYITIWLNQKLLSAELQLIAIYRKTKKGIQSLFEDLQRLILVPSSKTNPTVSANTEVELKQHTMENTAHSEACEEQSEVAEETSDGKHSTGITKESATGGEPLTKETLNAFLVTNICQALLPCKEVINDFGGLEAWHRMANVVLLFVGQISHLTNILSDPKLSSETSVFHFLRLCRDFVNFVVSLKLQNSVQLVSSLTALANESQCKDVLDNKSIFHYLTDKLKELHIPEVRLQAFICIYFNLCIEANLDTPILKYILQSISAETGTSMIGLRHVLLNILQNDIKEDSPESGRLPVCEDVIFSGEIDDDTFPNIAAIDEVLKRFDVESSFSVTCCDIIEEVAFKTLTW